MRTRVGIVVAAVLLLTACGGGDDEGLSASTCVERWNVDGNQVKKTLVDVWETNGIEPEEARAWVGASQRNPDVCAALIEFDRGTVSAYRQSTLEGGDKETWADAPGERETEADYREQMEDHNAEGRPGGELAVAE